MYCSCFWKKCCKIAFWSFLQPTLTVIFLWLFSRSRNRDQVGLNKMSPSHHVCNGTSATTSVWPPTVADEANAQFVNVCNWTNSMMSNVMSRMRTTNTLFNLSDSNSLYEYLYNKLDLDNRHRCSGSNSNSDETNRLKPSSADSNRTLIRHSSSCDQRPSGHNLEVYSLLLCFVSLRISPYVCIRVETIWATERAKIYEKNVSDEKSSPPGYGPGYCIILYLKYAAWHSFTFLSIISMFLDFFTIYEYLGACLKWKTVILRILFFQLNEFFYSFFFSAYEWIRKSLHVCKAFTSLYYLL